MKMSIMNKTKLIDTSEKKAGILYPLLRVRFLWRFFTEKVYVIESWNFPVWVFVRVKLFSNYCSFSYTSYSLRDATRMTYLQAKIAYIYLKIESPRMKKIRIRKVPFKWWETINLTIQTNKL